MANTFILHAVPNKVDVITVTKKADGAVRMGRLVTKGTAAKTVKETTADTDVVLGIAALDEAIAHDKDTASYQYEDTKVCRVEYRGRGNIYRLLAATGSTIDEGESIKAAAAGCIAEATEGSDEDWKLIGIALEQITPGNRGKCLVF